jgi:6,7-dimethyl-8-ribityllumazine synthase
MSQDQIRILIVEARFYSDLADELLKGAIDALSAHGAAYEVITVPGALEIPGAIALAEEGGHRPAAAAPWDGYVALGTVIRGETYHFEIVSNESAAGVSSVQLEFGIPVGNGILTCDTDLQALARMDQKGYEAAQAALEMANLLDEIDEQ